MPLPICKQTLSAIPVQAGIGLRPPHYQEVITHKPDIAWLEVHSENFFADGGKPHRVLEQVRAHYPLSLHGVGLSLGSTDPLNQWHLGKLKTLVDIYQPGLVSEHLSWNSVSHRYLNDLLPLPYTQEAIKHIVGRIQQVQDYLRRQILVENLSSYLTFSDSSIPEWEFVSEVARRSGCAILLDINNIYVNAQNFGFDATTYINAIPVDSVREMHLAGHSSQGDYLLDTHSQPVCSDVWALYQQAIRRIGPVPTLIEWDSNIPPLPVLQNEARKAQAILETCNVNAA